MRLFFFLSLLVLGSLASRAEEPFEFPVGLNSEFDRFSATLASPEVFDSNRDKPSVLVVSENPEINAGEREGLLFSVVEFSDDASFPPNQKFYTTAEHYLLRWILALAPDLVVTENASLREALKNSVPTVSNLSKAPDKIGFSPARAELQKRANRSSFEVADAVANHYGHNLKSVVYQPALAMIGRKRLAELKGEDISAELIAIVGKAPKTKKWSASHLSGHLVFAELGLEKITVETAERAIQNPMDNAMSDSVFMLCPLLAEAGRMTGDDTFYRECVAHFERIQKLCRRSDGLYRHSPLDEAAWGRGNGFPALGLAWVLSNMPEGTAGRDKILTAFQKHIAALVKYQDASGMWHQVIDKPGSYREFTCTCMITYAMLRGMREGWLDQKLYEPATDRGWEALKLRISLDGKSFTDACTGTGKQKSLSDYYLRSAILGPDERSGAMALLVATERAVFGKWKSATQLPN